MEEQNCGNCPMRLKYDENPKALISRFWKWHISWCPGWKKYMEGLDDREQDKIRQQYGLKSRRF